MTENIIMELILFMLIIVIPLIVYVLYLQSPESLIRKEKEYKHAQRMRELQIEKLKLLNKDSK